MRELAKDNKDSPAYMSLKTSNAINFLCRSLSNLFFLDLAYLNIESYWNSLLCFIL